ncbi:hypothetical protein X792_04920 [Dehalococcoides mccartyi CG1]|jgi:transcriptional regulator with XRE-family HTH domain|uniref:helix-turn-helix domain-containing protein n=1 Tax=Dehalococcoides mccartyi TaxID=61435 RepID=UPI0004E07CC7|nr:helix-turn-helix transcriptional regulator [Dehalococcoides mccartyi]AII58715.1 hypothetical protein X792_04920 [Dehalococcoides mccartyi CG1]
MLIEKYIEEYSKDIGFVTEGVAMEFIEQVIKVMKQQDMSEKVLAERIGISVGGLGRIFNFTTNPRLSRIVKIAMALGYNVNITLTKDRHGHA